MGTEAKASLISTRSMSASFMPDFFIAYSVAGIGRGEHPDRVFGAHAHVGDAGAGCQVVALERCFGDHQHGGGAVAGLAGHRRR